MVVRSCDANTLGECSTLKISLDLAPVFGKSSHILCTRTPARGSKWAVRGLTDLSSSGSGVAYVMLLLNILQIKFPFLLIRFIMRMMVNTRLVKWIFRDVYLKMFLIWNYWGRSPLDLYIAVSDTQTHTRAHAHTHTHSHHIASHNVHKTKQSITLNSPPPPKKKQKKKQQQQQQNLLLLYLQLILSGPKNSRELWQVGLVLIATQQVLTTNVWLNIPKHRRTIKK